jgi:hypothetical protein
MLVLRYLEDLPEAQVADLLGCSVGTVPARCPLTSGSRHQHLRPCGRQPVSRAGVVNGTRFISVNLHVPDTSCTGFSGVIHW